MRFAAGRFRCALRDFPPGWTWATLLLALIPPGCNFYDNEQIAQVTGELLSGATEVKATAGQDGRVALAWHMPPRVPRDSAVIVYRTDTAEVERIEDGIPIGGSIARGDTAFITDVLPEKRTYRFTVFLLDPGKQPRDLDPRARDTLYLPDRTPPGALTGLRITARKGRRLSIAWNRPGDDAARIRIAWARAADVGGALDTGETHFERSADAESADIPGLTERTWYRVAAWVSDSAGLRGQRASDGDTLALTLDETPPGPVSGLVLKATSQGSLTAVWNRPSEDDVDSLVALLRLAGNGDTAAIIRKGIRSRDTILDFTGLDEKTWYTARIVLADSQGNSLVLDSAPTASARTWDVTPPRIPGLKAAPRAASDSVRLSWERPDSDAERIKVWMSSDSVFPGRGVGTLVADAVPAESTRMVKLPSEKTTYRFGIFVLDSAGNWSDGGAPGRDTARLADRTSPEKPLSPKAAVLGPDSVRISWALPRIHDVESVSLEWSADTGKAGSLQIPSSTTEVTLNRLSAGTSYTLVLAARDSSGNASGPDSLAFITAPAPDRNPPPVPTGLRAVPLDGSSLKIEWDSINAPDLESCLLAYAVGEGPKETMPGSVLRVPAPECSVVLRGLAQKLAYEFTLIARDSAGNRSDSAKAPHLRTFLADTVAPEPVRVISAKALDASRIAISWEPSTSRDVAALRILYRPGPIFPNGPEDPDSPLDIGADRLADTLEGLSEGQSYSISIFSRDTTGNWGPVAARASVLILDRTPPGNVRAVRIAPAGRDAFALGWEPTTGDADSILLEYAPGNDAPGRGRGFPIRLPASARGLVASGFAQKTPYSFRISVRDSAGNWNLPGDSVTLTASLADDSVPANVSRFEAAPAGAHALLLSWTRSPAPDVRNIVIGGARLPLGNGPVIATRSLAPSRIGEIFDGLDEKTRYRFFCAVIDSAGNAAADTAWAEAVTADSTAPLDVTTLALPSPDTLAWIPSASADAESLRVVLRSDSRFPMTPIDGDIIARLGATARNCALPSGLLEKTAYAATVFARDSAGNWSRGSGEARLAFRFPDRTAPDGPAGLSLRLPPSGAPELSWERPRAPDADSVAIVYRLDGRYPASPGDGTVVVRLSAQDTLASMPGLQEKAAYRFTGFARDSSGNWSADAWGSRLAFALPDRTPPANVRGLRASPAGGAAVGLAWDQLAPGDAEAILAEYREGTTAPARGHGFPVTLPAGAVSMLIPGLEQKKTYAFRVSVRDSAGNWNIDADSATTYASLPDTVAPANVSGLEAAAASGHSLILSWSPSRAIDAASVRILVWRGVTGGLPIAADTVPAGHARDTLGGLSEKTRYLCAVVTVDSSGNAARDTVWSAATTFDVTPPADVSALAADSVGSHEAVFRWSAPASADADSLAIVARADGRFPSSPNDGVVLARVAIASGSARGAGLAEKAENRVAAFARDSSGNWSAGGPSARLIVPTPDRTPPENVTALSAFPLDSATLSLSWTLSVSPDADSLAIRIRSDGQYPSGPADGEAVAMLPADSSGHSLGGLHAGLPYRIALFVRDSSGNWSAPSPAARTIPDFPPVADAGAGGTYLIKKVVTLDGTGSRDPGGRPLEYHWLSALGNPAPVDIPVDRIGKPSFTPSRPGRYLFFLYVSNGLRVSAPDQVEVTIVDPEFFVTTPPDGIHFSTIQSAVDAASPGDTVYVDSGHYQENVTIGKDNLTVIGFFRDKTVVRGAFSGGQGIGSTFTLLRARNVSIRNMTIEWGGAPDPSQINVAGVLCRETVNATVAGNLIQANFGDGIRLYHDTSTFIADNDIARNDYNGIRATNTLSLRLQGNRFSANSPACTGCATVLLADAFTALRPVYVEGNTFAASQRLQIGVIGSYDARITGGNRFESVLTGIRFNPGSRITVIGNSFRDISGEAVNNQAGAGSTAEIRANTFAETGGAAVFLNDLDTLRLSGNAFARSAGVAAQKGVDLISCRWGILSDNTLDRYGIAVKIYNSPLNLEGNAFRENLIGIQVRGLRGNAPALTGNTFTGNATDIDSQFED